MNVPGVAVFMNMIMCMIVRMAGMAEAVIVTVVGRIPGHAPILPARKLERPCNALIRHFDTAPARMD